MGWEWAGLEACKQDCANKEGEVQPDISAQLMEAGCYNTRLPYPRAPLCGFCLA